jgi:putative nucleotidyltransferase with HDIG domain
MSEGFEKYIITMPVMPEVAARILAITEDKLDISFKELEDIIKVDPGLASKILKIANSALYARQREIKSLQQAITLLGFKNLKSLVMLISASGTFSRFQKAPFYQYFWKHSVLTAFLAKHMATRCNRKELGEDCFLAGLLHDIGQVAFYNADSERYQPVEKALLEQGTAVEELENKIYGTDHHEVGASLLAKWSFPAIYVDTAREHQCLNITSAHKALIFIVSVADLVAEIIRVGMLGPAENQLLQDLLERTDLNEEDLQYYRTSFMGDLQNDLLFVECRPLFGIRD